MKRNIGISFILLLLFLSNAFAQITENSRPSTGTINGHGYVDLGLSVMWATCNVGAIIPSDYGNHYAWGEIKTKSIYTTGSSVTHWRGVENIAGDPTYDVARANWGGAWRMPTKEEMEELICKCTFVWTKYGEHNGIEVTGPNGNSIFLPAAGYYEESSTFGLWKSGCYWSATPSPSEQSTNFAFSLYFKFDDVYGGMGSRYVGHNVRPVAKYISQNEH